MKNKELRLNRRDRDRLIVLEGIERGHWSQREGATQLGLSTRWVRNLLARRRQEGDEGIVHRLRAWRSNRRTGEAERDIVMAAVRLCYADFRPALATERLAAEGDLTGALGTIDKDEGDAKSTVLGTVALSNFAEPRVWRPTVGWFAYSSGGPPEICKNQSSK